eukprot:scaffold2230_cov166-Pinguiococcus_pyrenoidosus.AAC.1
MEALLLVHLHSLSVERELLIQDLRASEFCKATRQAHPTRRIRDRTRAVPDFGNNVENPEAKILLTARLRCPEVNTDCHVRTTISRVTPRAEGALERPCDTQIDLGDGVLHGLAVQLRSPPRGITQQVAHPLRVGGREGPELVYHSQRVREDQAAA